MSRVKFFIATILMTGVGFRAVPAFAATVPASFSECSGYVTGAFVGNSSRLNEIREQIAAVAKRRTPVHLSGETGSGKGMVAKAIHEASGRTGRFVAVNLAALPEALIERELFGHVKGAFTGATEASPGFFGADRGGTIFLDEIGRMPLGLQSKLLQVCDEGVYYPVGSTVAHTSTARIIVASSLDLRKEMAEGRFMADLFYRVSVFEIPVPALREHPEDIPAIATHLIGEVGEDSIERSKYFSHEAMALLTTYPWPGNVRELRNAVERAVIMSQDRQVMQIRDLPAGVANYGVLPISGEQISSTLRVASAPEKILVTDLDMESLLIAKEIALFREALAASNGNLTHAADALGLPVTTLKRRMTEIGMASNGDVVGDPLLRREAEGTNRRFVMPTPDAGPLDYHTAMWTLMRTTILTALDRAQGIKQEAARYLRMSPSTLDRRIMQLRIEWPHPPAEREE